VLIDSLRERKFHSTNWTEPACQALAMRDALMRQLYRLGYRVLRLVWLVRPPRGRGAKGLLTNAGQVLLVRHTYGPHEWELPGGGSRRGEASIATLRRELREELRVDVAEATSLGAINGPGRYCGNRVSYFTAELPSRDIVRDPVEIAEVAWFDLGSPPARLGWYAAQALVRHGEALASRASDPGSPPRG
jgi:8-oxo-dGTP pyrophosphatase MutT (NUDIX family)